MSSEIRAPICTPTISLHAVGSGDHCRQCFSWAPRHKLSQQHTAGLILGYMATVARSQQALLLRLTWEQTFKPQSGLGLISHTFPHLTLITCGPATMTHFPSDVTSFQDNAAEDEHGFGCMPFAMPLFSWDTPKACHPCPISSSMKSKFIHKRKVKTPNSCHYVII